MRYKKFEGDRLYFSPMDVNDFEIFTKWINDETLSRGLGNSCMVISEAFEKEYLEKNSKNCNNYQFAVIKKEDNTLIGTYDLHNISLIHGYAEAGGFIGEISERGKGYGTECLTMICDYGFNVLNLNNIVGRIFAFNYASINSILKAGFKQVGEIKNRYYFGGRYYNELIFQITKDEFTKNHKTYLKPLPNNNKN